MTTVTPEKAVWVEKRIGEVCNVGDGAHAKIKRQDSGVKYFTSKNFKDRGLDLSKIDYITEEDFSKHFKEHSKALTRPIPDDVVFSIIGSIGAPYLVRSQDRFGISSSVAILRPDKSVLLSKYLYYWVKGHIFQEALYGIRGGVAQGYVSLEMIKSLPLRLPSLITQHKIASALSAYDDLIENNSRRIEILEEMAQRIYREWFVQFRFPGHEKVGMVDSELGPIPKGWKLSTLGEVAEQVRRNVKPDQFDPETPYVGLEHIPRKSIALSEWGTAQEVQSSKLAFLKGEILFGKIRPYFHKVAVAPTDGLCSSDTIVISPRAAEHFSSVLCTVASEEFVNRATQTSQGTKMPRADWNVLVKYPVAIPSPVLLRQFNELVESIVGQIQNLVFRNRNLRQTRDLLLPKLISGELSVEELDVDPEITRRSLA